LPIPKAKSAAAAENALTPGRGRNPDAFIFKDLANEVGLLSFSEDSPATSTTISHETVDHSKLWREHVLPKGPPETVSWYSDNGFANSGFEVGPAFIENSSQGILLEADPRNDPFNRVQPPFLSVQSPLQEWSILERIANVITIMQRCLVCSPNLKSVMAVLK
nr:hypothetical protein [Tanacetum cinerariifolium]